MKIFVTDATDEKSEYQISKDKVIIGRGQDVDVKISNPNVSRDHLLIHYSNDEFFIEDISTKNWVKLDGKKISKNQKIKYFDHFVINLPGEINITLETDRSFEIDSGFINIQIEQSKEKSSKPRKLKIPKTLKLDKTVLKDKTIKLVLEKPIIVEKEKSKQVFKFKRRWFIIPLVILLIYILVTD